MNGPLPVWPIERSISFGPAGSYLYKWVVLWVAWMWTADGFGMTLGWLWDGFGMAWVVDRVGD